MVLILVFLFLFFLFWVDLVIVGLGCLGVGVGWVIIVGLLLVFFGCILWGIELFGIFFCGVIFFFWIFFLLMVCGLGIVWFVLGGLCCLYGLWLSLLFEKCFVSCIGDLFLIVGEIGVVFFSIDGGIFVFVIGICLGLVGEVVEGVLIGVLIEGFIGVGLVVFEFVFFLNISCNCEKGIIGMGISFLGFFLFLNLLFGKEILVGDIGVFLGVIGSLGLWKNLVLGGVIWVFMMIGFCCKGDW